MTKSKKQIILTSGHKEIELLVKSVHKNPFVQFDNWFNLILKMNLPEPNAMVLATADKRARPSARVVLLKGINSKGITFYTNYNSRKGEDLLQNPSAALLFYWAELSRQVRIEGKIKRLSRIESVKYFSSRPVGSQLAAWASEQSKEIADREYLEKRFNKFEEKFFGSRVPLPPDWGGFILIPDYFEFWQGRENRMHDRICYKKIKSSWKIFRLAP